MKDFPCASGGAAILAGPSIIAYSGLRRYSGSHPYTIRPTIMSISSVAADRRAFPALTVLLATGLVGPPLVVALAATGIPATAAAIGLIVGAAALLLRPAVRSPLVQLRVALGTPITLLFILGLMIATCYTVRLSGFMLDATRADLSVFPRRKFFREHACLTSYTEAARFAAEGLNIYEVQRYVDIPKPGEYKDRYTACHVNHQSSAGQSSIANQPIANLQSSIDNGQGRAF
jgi:hypothetical protein